MEKNGPGWISSEAELIEWFGCDNKKEVSISFFENNDSGSELAFVDSGVVISLKVGVERDGAVDLVDMATIPIRYPFEVNLFESVVENIEMMFVAYCMTSNIDVADQHELTAKAAADAQAASMICPSCGCGARTLYAKKAVEVRYERTASGVSVNANEELHELFAYCSTCEKRWEIAIGQTDMLSPLELLR